MTEFNRYPEQLDEDFNGNPEEFEIQLEEHIEPQFNEIELQFEDNIEEININDLDASLPFQLVLNNDAITSFQ